MAMPLSKSEEALLASCRTAKRRREVHVSRRLVRYGLRKFLGMGDDALEWRESGPRYASTHQSVGLSVAHSRDHVAAGFSTKGRVGIDVESLGARPYWKRAMESMFCDEDVDWITGDGPESDTAGLQRFLVVWTAREAYAKYRGESVLEHLSRPLLRDTADAGDSDGPYADCARVEVNTDEYKVVAVCRPWRDPMPVCLAWESESPNGVSPQRADFIFVAGASN